MPTTWSDWSEEAFRRAREEDKPILLYLAPTWCLLCREFDRSFWSKDEVGAVVNRDYVPVRVDPDRRPDVNDRYNVGGWPTTAFLTPQGGLIWGTASADTHELRQVVAQLLAGFRTHRDQLEEEIRKRDEKVEQARRDTYTMSCKLDAEVFRKTVRGILATFDQTYGGFGREPKFPMVPSIRALFSAFQETGGPDLREVLAHTLDTIGKRGLFDPSDGGFFRYCETESWTRPHTEKRCEENAGLIRVFLDGWGSFREEAYRDWAVRSMRWALSMLCDRERALIYAGQAADDEYYARPPAKRPAPPTVDRTQMTGWAAQMCSTFFRAGAVLEWEEPADFALRCLDRIVEQGIDAERGAAHCFDPEPRLHGTARSQVFLLRALLDAYEYSGRESFLRVSETILDFCRTRLWSEPERGLVDRPPGLDEWGELSRRRKNIQENALAAEAAVRLSYLAEVRHRDFAHRLLAGFPDFLDDYGHYTAEYGMACDFLVRPVVEIDLVAPTPELRRAALASSLPRRVVRHRPGPGPVAVVRRGTATFPPAHTAEELSGRLAELHG